MKKNFFLWLSGGLGVYGMVLSIANIANVADTSIYLRQIMLIRPSSIGMVLLYILMVGVASGFCLALGLQHRKKRQNTPEF